MSLNYYQYDNTYTSDSCQNIFSTTGDIPKGDLQFCSNYAFNNNSPFFILSDYNKTTDTADCIIKNNAKTNVTDKQINEWIGSLTKCNITETTCRDISNGSHYGGVSGYSIYLNPNLTTNTNLQIEDTNFGEFYTIYDSLVNTDMTLLSDTFYAYRKAWYNDVSINSESQIYLTGGGSNVGSNNDSVKLYDDQLSKVRKNLYNLYNIQANIEAQLFKFDIEYKNSQEYLKIVNTKLENSQQFFNSLMNKNQGSLGALDDSIYNTNSNITENIIMLLMVLISIFIYFKYIIN